ELAPAAATAAHVAQAATAASAFWRAERRDVIFGSGFGRGELGGGLFAELDAKARGRRLPRDFLVARDIAVAEPDQAVRIGRRLRVVCHHDHGLALLAHEALEKLEHLRAG